MNDLAAISITSAVWAFMLVVLTLSWSRKPPGTTDRTSTGAYQHVNNPNQSGSYCIHMFQYSSMLSYCNYEPRAEALVCAYLCWVIEYSRIVFCQMQELCILLPVSNMEITLDWIRSS